MGRLISFSILSVFCVTIVFIAAVAVAVAAAATDAINLLIDLNTIYSNGHQRKLPKL